MRILRCYLKHYSKWKHYDLSFDKQRELILNSELLDCHEEYVDEVIPYGVSRQPKVDHMS